MTENLQALLQALTQEERDALLKELKPSREKKEKTIVATRVQLVDTPDTAKVQRKAGEEFPLTEKALMATLKTWVRGKEADALIQANVMALAKGATLDYANGKFKIVGIARDIK